MRSKRKRKRNQLSKTYSLSVKSRRERKCQLLFSIEHFLRFEVQFSSVAQSCLTLLPHGLQPIMLPCPSLSRWVYSNSCPLSQCYHPILSSCHPLLPPSIFANIRFFSSESVLHIRWPQYWNFSFNVSPSNEYSGLISFRIDWLDLLAVQGTLKSLLQQFKSINSSALSLLYGPALTSIHDFWKKT